MRNPLRSWTLSLFRDCWPHMTLASMLRCFYTFWDLFVNGAYSARGTSRFAEVVRRARFEIHDGGGHTVLATRRR